MGSQRYVTSTDFLPKKGLIWLDNCGLQWVCRNEGLENELQRNAIAERLNGFYNVFSKRGDIAITPAIFEEVHAYLKACEHGKNSALEWKKRERRASRRKRYVIGNILDSYRQVIAAHNRLRTILANNVANGEYVSMPPEGLKLAEQFLDDFKPTRGSELSEADKGLVKMALASGDRKGLLTADVPVMQAYSLGTQIFNQQNSFLCDSIHAKTYLCKDLWSNPPRFME